MSSVRREVVSEVVRFNLTAILAPLLVFGFLGWLVDEFFGSQRLFLFVGIALAFITTQILAYRRLRVLSGVLEENVSKNTEVRNNAVHGRRK